MSAFNGGLFGPHNAPGRDNAPISGHKNALGQYSNNYMPAVASGARGTSALLYDVNRSGFRDRSTLEGSMPGIPTTVEWDSGFVVGAGNQILVEVAVETLNQEVGELVQAVAPIEAIADPTKGGLDIQVLTIHGADYVPTAPFGIPPVMSQSTTKHTVSISRSSIGWTIELIKLQTQEGIIILSGYMAAAMVAYMRLYYRMTLVELAKGAPRMLMTPSNPVAASDVQSEIAMRIGQYGCINKQADGVAMLIEALKAYNIRTLRELAPRGGLVCAFPERVLSSYSSIRPQFENPAGLAAGAPNLDPRYGKAGLSSQTGAQIVGMPELRIDDSVSTPGIEVARFGVYELLSAEAHIHTPANLFKTSDRRIDILSYEKGGFPVTIHLSQAREASMATLKAAGYADDFKAWLDQLNDDDGDPSFSGDENAAVRFLHNLGGKKPIWTSYYRRTDVRAKITEDIKRAFGQLRENVNADRIADDKAAFDALVDYLSSVLELFESNDILYPLAFITARPMAGWVTGTMYAVYKGAMRGVAAPQTVLKSVDNIQAVVSGQFIVYGGVQTIHPEWVGRFDHVAIIDYVDGGSARLVKDHNALAGGLAQFSEKRSSAYNAHVSGDVFVIPCLEAESVGITSQWHIDLSGAHTMDEQTDVLGAGRLHYNTATMVQRALGISLYGNSTQKFNTGCSPASYIFYPSGRESLSKGADVTGGVLPVADAIKAFVDAGHVSRTADPGIFNPPGGPSFGPNYLNSGSKIRRVA